MSKLSGTFIFLATTACTVLVIGPQVVPSLLLSFKSRTKSAPIAVANVPAKQPQAPQFDAIDATSTASIPSGASVGTSDSVSDQNSVRVVVHANQRVTLGAEINAKVLKIHFKDGERFRAGMPLIELDCARTDADMASATAAYRSHKSVYENNVAMKRFKAVGSMAVTQAKFEMEKAEADVKSLAARRSACTIAAPFDGRVVEKMAQNFEVVAPNQPLIKIVDESKPELDLIVPSKWLSWIESGTKFKVQIDETGETYQAAISQVGGAVDPVSQTVRLMAEIERPGAKILSGMSGTAKFAGDKK